MSTVGFVGLGAMGRPMALRLLEAGNQLVVYDTASTAIEVLTASGAESAASPRDVADRAEVVFVSLPDPSVVREVVLGDDGLAGGSRMELYIDVSTTGPAVAEAVATELAGQGVGCVDAPVSGGPTGAEKGTLTVMVSGDPDTRTRALPYLEALGKSVTVVGDRAGQGQTVKILNNLMSAAAIAITSEAVAVAVKSGLDPATFLEVIHTSSGANNAASTKFPQQVLTRKFGHGFRLALMAKDVRLSIEEAGRQKVPMLLGSLVEQLWNLGESAVQPGADCTELARLIEQWAGVTIESPTSAER